VAALGAVALDSERLGGFDHTSHVGAHKDHSTSRKGASRSSAG
jgi:hypothetical protein